MRRILLISDTHGNLDIINEKAFQTNADIVIHAGDFGFYDDQSIVHLSPRELRLLVTHSPVWRQYNVDKQTGRETLMDIFVRDIFTWCAALKLSYEIVHIWRSILCYTK